MLKKNKHILLNLLHVKPLTQTEMEEAMLAARQEDEKSEQAFLQVVENNNGYEE